VARSSAKRMNEVKADFSNVYNLDDPREYFRALAPLDYIIPHLAQNIFRQLIDSQATPTFKPLTVIDIGCSYGINAALMKYALTWDKLANRHLTPEMMMIPSEALHRLDRLYLRSWPRRIGLRIVGIDPAQRAIRYACDSGALDAGYAVDLESDPAPEALASDIREAQLILSTGAVGYVTEKSFSRIAKVLEARADQPWVASFVLRAVDYAPISRTLAELGLVTEKLEGATFIQRRFSDPHEMENTLALLRERGIDPSHHEARGLLHAELYVSRPTESVVHTPLNQLLSVATGLNKPHPMAVSLLGGTAIEESPFTTSSLTLEG